MEPGNSSRRRRPGGRRGQASPRPVAQDRDLPGSAGDGPSNEPSRERSLRGRSRHRNRNRRPVVSPPPPTPTAPFIRVLIDDDPGTGAGGTLPPPDESERPWPFETIGRYTGARGYGSRPCVRETSLYAERRRQSALARLVERTDGGELDGDSSAAPPSDYTGAEGAGIRPRVRQSALYSDRPRRPRHRGPAQTEEQPSEISSSDLGRAVTDLPTFEERSDAEHRRRSPSARLVERSDGSELDGDSSPAPPSDRSRAEGAPRVRQSILYSDRPREPRRRPESAQAKERPTEASSSELGRAVAELSISDAGARSGEIRPTVTLPSASEPLSVGDSYAPQSTEEKPTKDLDDDDEGLLRLRREYKVAHPPMPLRQVLDELIVAEHAARTAIAAKWGMEPPPPLKEHLPVDQESQSLQAQQQASADPQHGTSPRDPRHEASEADIIKNAEKWMSDDVMKAFQEYVEENEDLMGLEYSLDKLCRQCCSADYSSTFHHYNFTVRMKKTNSDDSAIELYFAEVKQIFGRKFYFCCPLEADENGHCYACKKKKVNDLRHPATGGFEEGSPYMPFDLWYPGEEEWC